MAEFLVVSKEQLQALHQALTHAQALLDGLQSAVGTLSLPIVPADASTSVSNNQDDEDDDWDGKPYRIAAGHYSYADVVALEISEEIFSLDSAWERVRPMVGSRSERGKDSMRRSLMNDSRFEPVQGRPGWFRRKEQSEEEEEEWVEPPEAVSPQPPQRRGNYANFQPPPFIDEDDLPF